MRPAASTAAGTSTYQRLRSGTRRARIPLPSSHAQATANVETIAQNPAKSGV